MAQERQRHTQKARLHGIVNKDGHYEEIHGQSGARYSLQANYPQKSASLYQDQAAFRPNNAVRYAGQLHNPNEDLSHADVDTRSHGIVLDAVEQPPYTRSAVRQPPPSSAQSSHENPISSQSHASYYTGHGPKGQPFVTTIPPVGPCSESDTDQLSVQSQYLSGSLFPSHFATLSTPPRFLKLNEKDKRTIDSTHQVVFFGAVGVGKTTIINYFLENCYQDIKELDQQVKMQSVSVRLEDRKSSKIMKLNIREANKHDIQQRRPKAYDQCEVAVVVFDLTNYDSLKEANYWITKIKEHIKENPVEFMLVGNKKDMISSDEIIENETKLANKLKVIHLDTCATNGLNMDELLEDVATLAHDQHTELNAISAKLTNLEKKFEEKLEEKLEENKKNFEEKLEEKVEKLLKEKFEENAQNRQDRANPSRREENAQNRQDRANPSRRGKWCRFM